MALGRYQDSLDVLDELKVLAPKESPIFVQKGKIYKKLGEKQKAFQAFTMALELD